MRSIEALIREVRQKPEAVRRRYMYGYVGVIMVVVIGIWLLSIIQSFQSIPEDVSGVKSQIMSGIPSMPTTPSLSDMAEKGKSLQLDTQMSDKQTPQNYFETEKQNKEQQPDDTRNTSATDQMQ